MTTRLTDREYAALFFPGREPNVRSTWEPLKGSDAGLDAKGMESTLNLHDGLLMRRVTESDTRVSVQFIRVLGRIDKLLEKLNALGVERVDSEDVAKLIDG